MRYKCSVSFYYADEDTERLPAGGFQFSPLTGANIPKVGGLET